MKSNPAIQTARCLFLLATICTAAVFPPDLSAQGEPAPYSVYFAHYAVGMGYTTTFTFVNTGTTTASGVFVLRDPEGNVGTPMEITISPGGVNTIRSEGASMRTGWATLEITGGNVTGVATFEFAERGGLLKSIAGVISSPPAQSATMPVEYDPALARETAYAICNPGTEAIEVAMRLFSDEGSLLESPIYFTLLPGQQNARYVHQSFSSLESFRGSVVFTANPGGRFLIMGLAQNQGLYSVIPSILGSVGAQISELPPRQ